MEVIAEPERFRRACDEARRSGTEVGFVPTMGDLHQGHARLIKATRWHLDTFAVYIFAAFFLGMALAVGHGSSDCMGRTLLGRNLPTCA